ncbi:Hsp20/alpha crystallin family protein [Flagellimonas nanhaiensis]|uniref:Hsp20/alpha crystallin family protein n=1 Tax=Flagellimonas nanhaiensis TaxID=2292706 RepID=A0A371JN03_9FLAO|nr:Hsp20/alpha crystallin family protein [Allomuricauda nanhaiensis]RDY58603.1 Hsp20/alpha crystallin family protein [Allomuricauda nanhaiensis]
MSLIKWNKQDDLFPSLPSFFDDFWGRDFVSGVQTGTTIPAVNITESEDAFDIEVAAPGLKKEDFKVNLENGMMTISSEKSEEKESEEKKVTRKEFSFSSFQRSFTLPESVQVEKINASYNEGVLKIRLPKKEEAKKQPPKQIEIK